MADQLHVRPTAPVHEFNSICIYSGKCSMCLYSVHVYCFYIIYSGNYFCGVLICKIPWLKGRHMCTLIYYEHWNSIICQESSKLTVLCKNKKFHIKMAKLKRLGYSGGSHHLVVILILWAYDIVTYGRSTCTSRCNCWGCKKQETDMLEMCRPLVISFIVAAKKLTLPQKTLWRTQTLTK